MEGLDLSMNSSRSRLSPCTSSAEDTDCSPVKDGETTPRKNKRKSSEPKKRADFSIKRFCPDTPSSSNDIEAEDGEGRYSENPPSTPETSTPSPPDNNEINNGGPLRIPQLPPRVPNGYLHPYPLSVPIIPMPPTMMSHMVARQQAAINSMQSTLKQQSQDLVVSQQKLLQQPVIINNNHITKDRNNKRPHDSNSQASQQPKQKSRKTSASHLLPSSSSHSVVNTRSDTSRFELPPPPPPPSRPPSTSADTSMDDPSPSSSNSRRSRKNYKNMTRERRVEANARERSRVHTISAAFENLRRAVPSYSYNQRLSKLAILRIACTYIMSLATLAGHDYSWDNRPPSFADCVDQCTKTIQTEGRAKRRH